MEPLHKARVSAEPEQLCVHRRQQAMILMFEIYQDF